MNILNIIATNVVFILILMALAGLNVAYAELDECKDYNYGDNTPAKFEIKYENVYERFRSIYYKYDYLKPSEKIAFEESLNKHLINLKYDPTKLQSHERNCLEIANSRKEASFDKIFAAIGMSDLDHDGTLDFMIGRHGGLFEHDTDVDDDGIPNYADVLPFENKRTTQNLSAFSVPYNDDDGDGIPNHIDWTHTRDFSENAKYSKEDFAKLQECLYGFRECNDERYQTRNYGILLIDRDQLLSKETINTIKDVLLRVFANCNIKSLEFCQNSNRPLYTLNKIYGSDFAYVRNSNDKPIPIRRGEVLLGNQAMYLYSINNQEHLETTNKINYLLRFLSITHEFMHALQYSFDYPENIRLVKLQNKYLTPKFIDHLNLVFEPMGIYAESKSSDFRDYYNVLFNEIATFPYASTFYNIDFNNIGYVRDWKKIKGSKYPGYKRLSLIRGYEYSDVFEWHAVQMEAYLVNLMIDYYANSILIESNDVKSKKLASIRQAFHCEEEENKGMYFENADPIVMQIFKQMFPVSESDLDYLTREYLLKSEIQDTEISDSCPEF